MGGGGLDGLLFQNLFLDQKHHGFGTRWTRGLWGLDGRAGRGLLYQNSFLDQKHHKLGARESRRDYGGLRRD